MNAVIYGFGCLFAFIFAINFLVAMMQKGLAGMVAIAAASFFISLWMFLVTATCLECNARITKNTKRDRKFCGSKCRNDFNMRRRVRGAELYDLFMDMRFNRAEARDKRLWGVMCSLASAYRDSDTLLRQGRKSWDADAAYARIPIGFSKGSGDKR